MLLERALAILRAAKEDIVSVNIAPDPDTGLPRAIGMIASEIGIPGDGPGDLWLREAAAWTWRIKLSGTMFMDLLADLRRRAHATAIEVFARNLKDLLLYFVIELAGQRHWVIAIDSNSIDNGICNIRHYFMVYFYGIYGS